MTPAMAILCLAVLNQSSELSHKEERHEIIRKREARKKALADQKQPKARGKAGRKNIFNVPMLLEGMEKCFRQLGEYFFKNCPGVLAPNLTSWPGQLQRMALGLRHCPQFSSMQAEHPATAKLLTMIRHEDIEFMRKAFSLNREADDLPMTVISEEEFHQNSSEHLRHFLATMESFGIAYMFLNYCMTGETMFGLGDRQKLLLKQVEGFLGAKAKEPSRAKTKKPSASSS